MSVMTVLGPVETEELGVVLAHEHCFIDIRHQFVEPEGISGKTIGRQRVGLYNLSILRANPRAVKDNFLLSDPEIAHRELEEFRVRGGKSVVELTTRAIGRDPYLLRNLAMSSGLNIIAGSGHYTYDTHPKEMDEKSIGELRDEIIEDLTTGINGSEVRAGVIGELGTSEEIHPNEKKVLRAAAEAHKKTGAPIFVHIHPWTSNGMEVFNILSKQGLDPGKVVICHSDVWIDMEYVRDLLSRGVMVTFDQFGKQHYLIPEDRVGFCEKGGVWSTDRERVKVLKTLMDEGFESQILLSSDVCQKIDLQYYGGWGYGHILRNIVPMMIEEGIGSATVDLFLKENPQRLLNLP